MAYVSITAAALISAGFVGGVLRASRWLVPGVIVVLALVTLLWTIGWAATCDCGGDGEVFTPFQSVVLVAMLLWLATSVALWIAAIAGELGRLTRRCVESRRPVSGA
jgi:hypothetical protein